MAIGRPTDDEGVRPQLVDHLRNSAGLPAGVAEPLRADRVGRLLGLLHDVVRFRGGSQPFLRRRDHPSAAPWTQ